MNRLFLLSIDPDDARKNVLFKEQLDEGVNKHTLNRFTFPMTQDERYQSWLREKNLGRTQAWREQWEKYMAQATDSENAGLTATNR